MTDSFRIGIGSLLCALFGVIVKSLTDDVWCATIAVFMWLVALILLIVSIWVSIEEASR